jgi:hypothetical protein
LQMDASAAQLGWAAAAVQATTATGHAWGRKWGPDAASTTTTNSGLENAAHNECRCRHENRRHDTSRPIFGGKFSPAESS